ncbi:helix-turn-helix domain-containing protein [Methylobacterium sp. NPDC080182]|uniref:helix-turn-helix domain-containing protein n=1 Tax=Methylobacterium sp. NPDC080182 TaxID=3390590 RepID=UPI003D0757D4
METIFSTDEFQASARFRRWREVCEDRLVPMAQQQLGSDPFHAHIEGGIVGSLAFTKFTLGNVKAATTPQTIRHENNKTDQLFFSLVLSGVVCSEQNGHSNRDVSGDICIRDTSSPWTIEHRGNSEVLAVAIPRTKLEGILGSSRRFTGLTAKGNLPTTRLATSFLRGLLSENSQLSHAAADKMSSIAIDLIAASLAERMALDTPKTLHSTVLVHRAKTYAMTNLADPDLEPSRVAAAVGISLRQLQSLFREHGQSVAAWIWQQRIERTAQWLTNPALLRLPLGEIARQCGFADQAHFSKRFRDHYGLTPSAYRDAAVDTLGKR